MVGLIDSVSGRSVTVSLKRVPIAVCSSADDDFGGEPGGWQEGGGSHFILGVIFV